MTERRTTATSIGDALNQALSSTGTHHRVRAQQVILEWDSAVGAHLARAAQPLKIDDGTLIIRAANSVWRAELMMRKTELAKKINEYFQAELVRTVVIR